MLAVERLIHLRACKVDVIVMLHVQYRAFIMEGGREGGRERERERVSTTHYYYICVTLDPKIKETTQTTNQIKCEWALRWRLTLTLVNSAPMN